MKFFTVGKRRIDCPSRRGFQHDNNADYSRLMLVSFCLLSSASSLSLGFSSGSYARQQRAFPLSPRTSCSSSCTWLRQSSTTLQETVTLQWTDFHAPDNTENTPVLLLHGLLGSKRNFASLAASLGAQLEQQRRIFGVDLRNHGDSDRLEGNTDRDGRGTREAPRKTQRPSEGAVSTPSRSRQTKATRAEETSQEGRQVEEREVRHDRRHVHAEEIQRR